MLWDLIRDFFVMHVFGGMASNMEYYYGYVGGLSNSDDNWNGTTAELVYKVGQFDLGGGNVIDTYISMADWLSTIATLISITIIVVLCCLFIYKIVRLIGGLIR